MRDHIRRIRNELLATEDTVCLQRAQLVTEAFQRHDADPVPLRRAKAFAHVLRNMDLDVHSNPFFAGNTSSRPRAWMLVPEHGMTFGDSQVVVENPCLKDFLAGKIPEDLRSSWVGRSFGGACAIGHLAVDLHRVVRDGLEAIIAETQQHADKGTEPERIYRKAMAIALRAVIEWADRYADAATSAAQDATDAVVREAHLRVAQACRHVPAKPARNLFEGLQAICLVHLALAVEGHGMSVSVGLPDRVLAHLIGDSFDAELATDLIAAFMLKLTANSVFGRASKTQAITVGGVDHEGKDQCNHLTLCFMDAANIARVGDPHLFLRWHDNIAEAVKERALELLSSGLSMPLLVHDVPTAQGFMDAGCKPEDASEYCIIGCNELGIPGRSMESATSRYGLVQHLAILNQVLLDHPDPDGLSGMTDLMKCVEQHMRQRFRQSRENGQKHKLRTAECVPMPFTSALMRGCVRRGRDFTLGMDYQFPCLYERGLTNAANALAAIQQLVFETGSMKLSELLAEMRDDFRDSTVREQLLAAPKWGNDDDRVDRWAITLVETRDRVLGQIDGEFGQPPHFICHVVRSLHHTDGRRIAASPDGRHAWTPVCDSIGAQTGTAKHGPTAILKSVLKLDAARHYRGGYNLNITLPKRTAVPETLRPLVETFFGQGGQELQINCLDASTLRQAQASPARHGDLVVRFAGLNSRFVDLSRAEQDEVIERAQAYA